MSVHHSTTPPQHTQPATARLLVCAGAANRPCALTKRPSRDPAAWLSLVVTEMKGGACARRLEVTAEPDINVEDQAGKHSGFGCRTEIKDGYLKL